MIFIYYIYEMGIYTTNPSILLQSNILKKRGDDKYDCDTLDLFNINLKIKYIY